MNNTIGYEAKWAIVANLYNTTFTAFFFFLAFCMFYIAKKGFKSNNKYGGSSTFLSGIIFIFLGFYNSLFWFFPYPFIGFMIWWVGIIVGINLAFALIIRNVVKKYELDKKDKDIISSKNAKKSALKSFVELMMEENPYKEKISIKMEGIRKSFHLAGFLIILAYFGFFFIAPITQITNDTIITFINQPNVEWSYNLLWGDVSIQYPYTTGDFQAIIDLTLFALMCTLILTIISDLFRVIWGAEYSIFAFLTRAVLRKKEYNAAGPQIYLVLGVIMAYLFYVMELVHIMTVVAGVLIACFSDALAALIGRKWGKHKVKCIGGDIKSWEGFLAGAGSAYFIGFIVVGPVYALIGAVIFFLLDYFPIIVADNLLNPILITIGIGLVHAMLGGPIGWF